MLSRTTTGGGLCHSIAEVLLTAIAADSVTAYKRNYGSLSALCTAGDCISRISYSTHGLPSILLQAAAPLPLPVLLPSFSLFGVLGMGGATRTPIRSQQERHCLPGYEPTARGRCDHKGESHRQLRLPL
jgi:hypothetical protein